MSFFSKLMGESHTRGIKEFQPMVPKINALEEKIRGLSDAELRVKTDEFRKKLGVGLVGYNFGVIPAKAGIQSLRTQEDMDSRFRGNDNRNLNPQADAKEIDSVMKEILPEAFAVVREAARRTLGQRHFDVQQIGGMVLNSGAIAEMRTGEGKTLVATLPAYLNALTGKGVHIVTVNDYLSRRDAVWMGQIYSFLGLSVAVINHESSFLYDPTHRTMAEESDSAAVIGLGEGKSTQSKTSSTGRGLEPATASADPEKKVLPGVDATTDSLDKTRDVVGGFRVVHEYLRPCTRHEAYMADITYGTNNEFGFDYLRDNLEYSKDKLRQREFNYAIVDEIDSILIDEARTPLIISAPTRDAESTYKQFAQLVSTFVEDKDYIKEEKHRSISLTAEGITKAEKALGIDNIYTDRGIKAVHHLETAIRAKALYQKDKEYVVKDNEVMIVDEFTGRIQPGRRWSEGLHQAIEAKEGVSIQQESRTYASITFQNFFRMYPKLSGMTGTAATSSEEFFKVYGLEVYSIPTNVPAVRLDKQDQIFRTEIGKYKAIARKVKELHGKGQPVLIGTVSIEKNEVLSQFLKAEGIPHELLNAKNHEREGEIIAQAGHRGGVTIATNMAGRGVDIKLGGNPNTKESYEEVKGNGGLFVLGTERHEARRIDNQLRGRSGRQGDPGETQFFVSLEDSLMRVFASDTLKSMMGRLGMPEDEAIEHRIISKSLESAQEKIEGFNFDSRKHVLEFDDVINKQRTNIYSMRRRLLLGSIDEVETELYELVGVAGTGENLSPQADAKGTVPSSPIHAIIQKKIAQHGREAFFGAVRVILLQIIDMFWVEHLEVMDHTRSSVNLRAYGQRDPLVEYKKEGLRLFKEMQGAMKEQVTKLLPNIVPVDSTTQAGGSNQVSGKNAAGFGDIKAELREIHENAQMIGAADGSGSSGGSMSGAKKEAEVGRNDPCPCGSGKKYKKCHARP